MKKIFFIIIFYLITLTKINAQNNSEDLIYAGVGSNGLTNYVNMGSIRKDKNGITKVWVYSIKEGEMTSNFLIPENFKQVKMLYEIKCDDYSMRITRYAEYDDKGINLSDTDASYSKFEEVIPDTIGSTILNEVCKTIK